MKLLVALLCLLSIISIIMGKHLSFDDDDFEMTNDRARMFLRQNNDDGDNSNDETDTNQLVDRREFGTNCVPCKFKVNPCCAPNICVKKFLWNECMEIKNAGK
jgi:hypothetical protein